MISAEIKDLEAEISELRNLLQSKEQELQSLKIKLTKDVVNPYTSGLSSFEIARYSRQMLITQFGAQGQKRLRDSHVLVVGAGGLGCPAALYLAAAGIGHVSIIDNDEVEISNLHRQILHNEHRVGIAKVDSAKETMQSINSSIRVTPHHMHATALTLPPLFAANSYDVVIDGTDNVATRYLLNDVCAMYGRGGTRVPLVSGSALQLEGQLSVYNYGENGPCYRCLFPIPPPPETVTSCGDGGVLGGVPGVIGVLQAIEAIKIISKMGNVLSGRFLTFDASDMTFRNIKLRNKDSNCALCGENATTTKLIDYEQFCGAKSDDKVHNINILEKSSNVSVDVLKNIPKTSLIIDVRPSIEFEMCHIANTLNFPYDNMKKCDNMVELRKILKRFVEENKDEKNKQVHLLCRRGNDSQRALVLLNEKVSDLNINFFNIIGGLHNYAKKIDSIFPVY